MTARSTPRPNWRQRLALAVPVLIAAMAMPALASKAGYIAPQGGAAPAITTITGSPLTVLVGGDQSFQIVNDQVPGSGQIYPSQTTSLADMGWMVRTGGALYTPDFSNHGTTATSNLGTVTPYTAQTISPVTGTGTEADPFVVAVNATLGATGLQSRQEVRYVNGKNFFTKRFTLTNTSAAPQEAKIYLGGDIYLAASDSGIPYREVASGSPGGSDCGTPASYYILYIPQTPADSYTGNGYSNVWSQIGTGDLDGALGPANCMDNGAALQWNRTLAAGASVTILAATSFGEIPSIAQFDITSVTPRSGAQGATVPVTIQGIGFATGMTVAFGTGVSVADLVVVDADTATATLTIAADAPVGLRNVTGVNAAGTLNATLVGGFEVTGGGPPVDPFALTRVVPPSGYVGTTMQVTLQGTGFAAGMAVAFGDGIAVSNLAVTNATTATVTLTIAADAVPGPRTVSGTNAAGNQTSSLPNGFIVLAAGPGPQAAQPVPTLGLGSLLLLALGLFGAAWAIFRR